MYYLQKNQDKGFRLFVKGNTKEWYTKITWILDLSWSLCQFFWWSFHMNIYIFWNEESWKKYHCFIKVSRTKRSDSDIMNGGACWTFSDVLFAISWTYHLTADDPTVIFRNRYAHFLKWFFTITVVHMFSYFLHIVRATLSNIRRYLAVTLSYL